jgi:cysteine desulfurase/selenocysteine lyase
LSDLGLRHEFPLLAARPELHFLDTAASAQKPRVVLEAEREFYSERYANIHRGAYSLSVEATDAYEGARARIAAFLNASPREVVFVRGATEAINLVAHSFPGGWREGDEIVLTEMEHHANIVPWQLAAQRSGLVIRVVPVTEDGRLELGALDRILGPRTRLVAVGHISNALGTLNPVEQIIRRAREVGAMVLVDGAQSVPGRKVDLAELDPDFFVFSGHKTYGPTGVGVLVGRNDVLPTMPPYQGGGDMIAKVSFEGTTFKLPPGRFEAGTPNIAGAVGLARALDFLEETGLDKIEAHETALAVEARSRLLRLGGVTVYGPEDVRSGIVSFNVAGVHPHDLATVLDQQGVAIRAGHHCCQPLWHRYGVPGSARASFGLYNTMDDVEALIEGVQAAQRLFA